MVRFARIPTEADFNSPKNLLIINDNGEYLLTAELQLPKEYPDMLLDLPSCGKITIRMGKNDNGYYFKSIILKELAEEVKKDITFEDYMSMAHDKSSMEELITTIAEGEQMTKEMQVCLQGWLSGHAENIYSRIF